MSRLRLRPTGKLGALGTDGPQRVMLWECPPGILGPCLEVGQAGPVTGLTAAG